MQPGASCEAGVTVWVVHSHQKETASVAAPPGFAGRAGLPLLNDCPYRPRCSAEMCLVWPAWLSRTMSSDRPRNPRGNLNITSEADTSKPPHLPVWSITSPGYQPKLWRTDRDPLDSYPSPPCRGCISAPIGTCISMRNYPPDYAHVCTISVSPSEMRTSGNVHQQPKLTTCISRRN